MERRRLASGAHRQKRLLFERCLSRANGRVICLPINKSGRGCDRETHRRLPVPGADATDRCRCAIQIRKSLEQKASGRGTNPRRAASGASATTSPPASRTLVGWLVYAARAGVNAGARAAASGRCARALGVRTERHGTRHGWFRNSGWALRLWAVPSHRRAPGRAVPSW